MSRCLLHKSRLDAFKAWLEQQGIEHRPGRGDFQVLQVCLKRPTLPRDQWSAVYDRHSATEHYTVTTPLENTVKRFIRAPQGEKDAS